MATQFISSRELVRSYARIKNKPGITIVMERSTPKNIIVPYSEKTLKILEKEVEAENPFAEDIRLIEEYKKKHKKYDPIMDILLERLKDTAPFISAEEMDKFIDSMPE